MHNQVKTQADNPECSAQKISNLEFFHEVSNIFLDTETTSNASSKLSTGKYAYIQDK